MLWTMGFTHRGRVSPGLNRTTSSTFGWDHEGLSRKGRGQLSDQRDLRSCCGHSAAAPNFHPAEVGAAHEGGAVERY